MAKILVLVAFLSLCLFGCQPAEVPEEQAAPAEEPAPSTNRGTAQVTIGAIEIKIDYGQPELQGRDMLGKLQDGQVWRLGMNEATTLETSGDLTFGESVVPSGKYSIWAKKVSPAEWHLIFNSEPDIWGTERQPDKDVAEVPMEVSQLDESVEQFLIELNATGDMAGEIVMSWATLQLKVPFSVSS